MDYLLIWDIDGTLIQGRSVGRRALERAFFESFGIADALSGVEMAGRLDTAIVKDAFALHGITSYDMASFFDKHCENLRDEIKKLNSPYAAPGIQELLPVLESKGSFYNVLGTGNIERGARIKLGNDSLNKYFPTGGFGDEPLERWQIIEKAISNAKNLFKKDFEKENIYVIGDTPRDIECGKKLGVKTIGTATGPFSAGELQKCGADYVFEDLSDTNAFLNIFN